MRQIANIPAGIRSRPLLFLFWWGRYDWPASTEFRALFGLSAFGVLVARIGLQSRELLGYGASGWD